jgi:acyl-homoserine-lactone acylase
VYRSIIVWTFSSWLLLGLSGCGEKQQAEEPSTEVAPAPAAALPGQGEDAGRTVIYRDTWGVPHIYAPTVEAGLFAMGYAQAQDRPRQLLLNIKTALGELAEVEGPDAVGSDLRARMFGHLDTSRQAVAKLPADRRGHIEAFAAGVRAFYAEHPADLPDWWGDREIETAMIDAFGRFFLYNWSIGEAYGDLARGGIEPGFEDTPRASNQWAVAPSRTADGHAMLFIDPHLAWWGPSRFWEVRIHAGELEGSGVGLPGSPFIGLGHNANIAWAMTTGGPDTADVYELTLDPADPGRYRYDGEWRALERREARIGVAGAAEQLHMLEYSHHGPVIARRGGKAYAAKIPYDATADRNLAWSLLNFAKDWRGAEAAAATLSMFPQNVMVADTGGNVWYQRTGRVPVRPDGFDWTRPVDGSTSASEWQGLHPASDHLQILNPQQGYLQNNNIPPDAMLVGGLFDPAEHRDYLFGSAQYGPARSGWINQRGARALERLHADADLTVAEALEIVMDVKPYGVERWLAALSRSLGDPAGLPERMRLAMEELDAWNHELRADSTAALKYAYWRFELEQRVAPEDLTALRQAIDDHYAIVEDRPPRSVELTDAQSRMLADHFATALERMQTELGRLDATFGDVFRVGRDDRSWPVEGGAGAENLGLTTLRTVGYGPPNERFERWGQSGQTSTQLVVLSKPIRSWIYLPVGQSDRPDSPHYADQAEQLFSPRIIKPSWWLPEDLAPNVSSRQELAVPEIPRT